MSNKFTVIRGGLSDNVNTSRREITEAYITNTRLMGVLTLYLHVRLPENNLMTDIHQFFYFDIEEYGFEDYKSVKNGDLDLVKSIEDSLMGGLGGDNITVTEREAAYLVQKYAKYNRKHGLSLPEGYEDYAFLLNMPAELSEEELRTLNRKQCVEIDSPYEVVNYFLMRCAGKDFEGAALLSAPGLNIDLFPDFRAGTFCKNIVKRSGERNTYSCESLVEFGENYHLMVSEIVLDGYCVTGYERISAFRISPSEAALMLARPEYITVFEIPKNRKPFTKKSTELTRRASVTEYDTGKLYMVYHPNNKHVAKEEYRLNEDVLGIYFVTGNQLLAAAYTLNEIRILEYHLRISEDYGDLTPIARYEFMEPIIFDFVQSGLDDFQEFVSFLRSFEGEN